VFQSVQVLKEGTRVNEVHNWSEVRGR